MATSMNPSKTRIALGLAFLLAVCGTTRTHLSAQTPAAPAPATATATVSQVGTVKSISGSTLTMATDKGATVSIIIADGTKVLALAVGSTDLKTAKPGQLSDIAVGDRALVAVKPGAAPDSLTALRVILMKSSDIAQMQASQQADWKARGTAGIVSTIDASGAITVTSGTRKTVINTSAKTTFKRFAGDSVKYQDAKPGTIAQIQPKDQIQARGAKSADGTSMQAEEVISGSFENLSGLLLSVDEQSGNLTLKDLATKKTVNIHLTTNSDIRSLPLQMATRFAQQSNGGQGGGRRGGGGGGPDASSAAAGDGAGSRRAAGADLSQMIGRLPPATISDLHKGDAVMVVASESAPNASAVTAVTVLTGVDPILTANPNGGMDLSMSLGGGGGGGAE